MGEAKIGISLRLFRKERDSLQKADFFSARAFPSLGFLLSHLSSFNLSCSHSRGKGQPLVLEMDHGRNDAGLIDLRVNIHHLYGIMAIGIINNIETAKEVKKLVDEVSYVSYQTSNHDARIDDNEMNLKEIMGKIDHIQEDLHLLVLFSAICLVLI